MMRHIIVPLCHHPNITHMFSMRWLSSSSMVVHHKYPMIRIFPTVIWWYAYVSTMMANINAPMELRCRVIDTSSSTFIPSSTCWLLFMSAFLCHSAPRPFDKSLVLHSSVILLLASLPTSCIMSCR